jgi:hypothetical protein
MTDLDKDDADDKAAVDRGRAHAWLEYQLHRVCDRLREVLDKPAAARTDAEKKSLDTFSQCQNERRGFTLSSGVIGTLYRDLVLLP